MTKDRLQALKANQDDAEENELRLSLGPQEKFMEEFFNQVEDIRTNIENIQKYVNEVKKLHNTILSAPNTDDKMKDELEERMAEIKKTALKVRQKLKDMAVTIESTENKEKSQSAEVRIKKLQFNYLSYSLNEIMTKYNAVQLEHRENLKKRIVRQLEISGKKTDEEEIEKILESGSMEIFTDEILIEANLAKQTLADITARHKDILKLEESIKELHDMFMDMAMLVESQGEMIDRIEFNILQSVDYVKEGKVQTHEAVGLQKAARRKKIILIIIAIIVVLVIIIILVVVLSQYIPKTSSSSPSSSSSSQTSKT